MKQTNEMKMSKELSDKVFWARNTARDKKYYLKIAKQGLENANKELINICEAYDSPKSVLYVPSSDKDFIVLLRKNGFSEKKLKGTKTIMFWKERGDL